VTFIDAKSRWVMDKYWRGEGILNCCSRSIKIHYEDE
jgi:hypothetical protein